MEMQEKKNRMRNEERVNTIDEKMRETHLIWFGNV